MPDVTPGQAAFAAFWDGITPELAGQPREYMWETSTLRDRWDAAAQAVHSEALAEADRQVSAALATVSRWQDENQRLIAERDEAREGSALVTGALGEIRAVLVLHEAGETDAGKAIAEVRAAWDAFKAAATEDDEAETAAILADPETMAAVAGGDRDLADDIATRGLDHWEGQHDDD